MVSIAAVSLNQLALDLKANVGRIISGISKAKQSGAEIICFSELCLSGYGCEDWFLSDGLKAAVLEQLGTILPHTGNVATIIGLPLSVGGKTYNSAAVLADKKLHGFYLKQNLANDGVYYERRWFTPATVGEIHTIQFQGQTIPAGDLVFDIAGIRLGFELCEDAWVPDRPAPRCLSRGVNCIINPSGSHFRIGHFEKRKKIVLAGSALVNGAYIYCNALGNESGRLIFDGGNLFANNGVLERQGKRFSFEEIEIDIHDFAPPKNTPTIPDVGVIAVTLEKLQKVAGARAAPIIEDWEQSPQISFEEFSRATALGLGDYRRKTGAAGFVISLSGGIDSAAVAVLVRYLETLAATTGAKEFWLGNKKLLTCVYQATAQSSEKTFLAARAVGEGVGSDFFNFNVEQLVQDYKKLVEGALQRELTWRQDDTTLQNIQARVRSPSVWLLANAMNAILLTTSNRSEAAVGYCTMDGDTSGGLCPLGGVSKDFLRSWLAWARDTGIKEVGPLKFLEQILAMPPTAELRPGGQQTDEGDLMPYAVLQKIERQAIFEKKLPADITDVEKQYVDRFFTLWQNSQWKRERLAPAFHIDEYSVDPKTWCRFPILSKLAL